MSSITAASFPPDRRDVSPSGTEVATLGEPRVSDAGQQSYADAVGAPPGRRGGFDWFMQRLS